ncbi:MAG: HPr kinase/phosphorylase [Terracidiphilus sp.]
MESTLPALAVPTLDILTVEQIKSAYACRESVAYADPMLARAALPLQQTFYPYGFPLQIFTNSEEVLGAAKESWQGFRQLFEIEPIRFHVGVTEGGSPECPRAPSSRVREHLCSHVADGDNFAISDASRFFSYIWLAQSTLAHRSYVRYFILESSAMFHLAARHCIGIHAACAQLDGNGILFCGDSGAGKSTLAYACARAGWTYITDDASFLVNGRDDSLVVGNCRQLRFRPSAEDLFPELHGLPILQRAQAGRPSIEWKTAPLAQVATSFCSRIKHVVFLNRSVGLRSELVSFPPEVARTYILQRGIGVPEIASLQTAGVDRLLDRGVFELRYADLDSAIERLTRLVKEGQ